MFHPRLVEVNIFGQKDYQTLTLFAYFFVCTWGLDFGNQKNFNCQIAKEER